MSNIATKLNTEAPDTKSVFIFIKVIAVAALSALIPLTGILTMIGPQIMVVVPLAIIAGMVFAVKKSSWSWVCFGYPLTFALLSAWIGFMETPGYEHTLPFFISLGIGFVGVSLIATGLWKVSNRLTNKA